MRIINLYPLYSTQGAVFADLYEHDVPWKNTLHFSALDLYYMAVSSLKSVNPYFETYTREQIAKMLYDLHIFNWNKVWEALSKDYNPIENYDMSETSEDTTTTDFGHTLNITDTNTNTPNITTKRTPDITTTDSGSSDTTTTPNLTTTDTKTIAGFNSVALVPDSNNVCVEQGTTSATQTNSNTNRQSGTDTSTMTGSTKDDRTRKETNGGTDLHTVNHSLSRHGNIGVTTSQQMVESELKLRATNFIKNIVVPDINNTLTLSIYEWR